MKRPSNTTQKSPSPPKPATRIAAIQKDTKPFGITADGAAVDRYTLTNGNGARICVINYGATITQLFVPDRNGKLGDVVLGFDNLRQYELESPFFGCVVGRFGNRIAKGMFTLDGVAYALATNNGVNHLHGGIQGMDKRVWNAAAFMTADGPTVRFTLTDPDGTEGYPGTVKITLIYTLTSDNTLKIQYFATTDKPTPINLTHHSYFNLLDGGKTDILSHVLQVESDFYLPVDATAIPTGQIVPVQQTPIDFTSPKPIGARLQAMGGDPAGYDHNMILRSQDATLTRAAQVYEPTTGRVLTLFTTEPGVQLYTGGFIPNTLIGKGTAYGQYHGLCLETQHYPDSVNRPEFPSAILRPGQIYRQITEYRFSTR